MFANIRRDIADALKKRNVRKLIYFHCDHFEPWRGFQGDVSEKNVDDILNFLRAIQGVDYAGKLTLFYKCNNYIRTAIGPQQLRAEGDEIGFAIQSARETNIARVALEQIAHHSGHEIQVHYHHEFFTGNEKYCMSMPETREFFRHRNTPDLDRERWEVGLRLALETIRLEAQIPLDKWFFVHGMWALNGSDKDVCTITDEICRLQKYGCQGDFTFPAGRAHCDPKYTEPVFVRPVDGFKSYDFPEADAVPAYRAGMAAGQGKFFIWSSAIKAGGSSIDYFSPEVRQRCEDIGHWAQEIVNKSVCQDGTLFVKTHAHSMYADYFVGSRRPIPPHLYPGVQNLFCSLFDGASDAGVDVEVATVSEVYDQYITPESATAEKNVSAGASTADDRYRLNMASSTTGDVQEILNHAALDVMRDRVSTLGDVGAGAYAYYGALIEQGRMLQRYEIEIADYILEQLTTDRPIIEIGCGLGILAMLLAARGRTVFGVEGDQRRLDSFTAIHDAVGEILPAVKQNCHPVAGFFPNNIGSHLPDDAALIFTNTICGIDLEEQQAIIAAARNFSMAIFDVERFFVKRSSIADIDELLGLFSKAGFTTPTKVLDLGDNGKYYLGVASLPTKGV